MSGLSIGFGVGLKYFSPIRKGKFVPPQPDPAYPAGCIHRSKNYGRSNNDADRDIIKDLSGTGTDIQLYNFGYALNSGFGLYATDFTQWKSVLPNNIITKNTIKSTVKTGDYWIAKEVPGSSFSSDSLTVKVNNTSTNSKLKFYSPELKYIDLPNGIHKIPKHTDTTNAGFFVENSDDCNITIEQIPDYQGALVSDGVDDYGLCENFPILTKEKGYTMLILRDWILRNGSNQVLISDNKDTTIGEYILVNNNIVDAVYTRVFGTSTSVKSYFKTEGIVVCSSSRYNDFNLSQIGETATRPQLRIFRKASVALYALEIYDHDLTDEEIQAVKSRMIREYEEGTGLPYDEAGYFKLDSGKLDVNKLK